MMKRIAKLDALKDDPWYGRLVKRLKKGEMDLIRGFIATNDSLEVIPFEMASERWYLDDPKKPKNLSIMVELLLVANSPPPPFHT